MGTSVLINRIWYKAGDLAIVVATLLGPVLAVQAQKWIERGRDRRQRRLWIFRTLMATRASNLSPAHVEAINAVPIEFYGKNKSFKAVVEAWKTYIDYLYQDKVNPDVWVARRLELFNEMILLMAKTLGYNFTAVEIGRELYSPKAHAQIETDQKIIREGLAAVFRGDRAFPLDIKTFPSDPDFVARQAELQVLLLEWLAGQGDVKVIFDQANKR
ncbi:DUF6680 family protein [Acidiphilium sp.]|uniref:DUF6680 family protein n=1 Tax=Acidiphilium sp. TaxID=527 RepID=UPI002589641C|nr:DUF6680 family protein [Acidiphilium sp.]